MPDRAVTLIGKGKLALLQVGVGVHAVDAVCPGKLEHGQVEGVEAGEGDELEFVTHLTQPALERGDLLIA